MVIKQMPCNGWTFIPWDTFANAVGLSCLSFKGYLRQRLKTP